MNFQYHSALEESDMHGCFQAVRHGTNVFRQCVRAWRWLSSPWRGVKVTTRSSCQAVTTDALYVTRWRRLPWSHLSVCNDIRRTSNTAQHLNWVQASLTYRHCVVQHFSFSWLGAPELIKMCLVYRVLRKCSPLSGNGKVTWRVILIRK